MDMGQGAEVQSVQLEGPTRIQDATVYAGGGPEVPMTRLDAGPAVPAGMTAQPEQEAMTRDEKGTFLRHAQGPPVPGPKREEPSGFGPDRPSRRDPAGPYSGLPAIGAPRTARQNVSAHRQMGLRTVNQQPRFDNSALLAAQAPVIPPAQSGVTSAARNQAMLAQQQGAITAVHQVPIGGQAGGRAQLPLLQPRQPFAIPPAQSGRTTAARHQAMLAQQQQQIASQFWQPVHPGRLAVPTQQVHQATGPRVPGKQGPRPGPLPPAVAAHPTTVQEEAGELETRRGA